MSWFSHRPKVFCIGRNKTGTTSMAAALRDLGYRVGNQARAENLLPQWAARNFSPIIRYCRTASAFQDIPFSLDYTYQAVDQEFPGSRFVLTVRDSSGQWYESLVRFHTRLIGRGRLPTADDLKQHVYREKGYLWRAAQWIYGVDEATVYDPALYKRHYEDHNERVQNYFANRPQDLLVINPASPDAMRRLCEFLGHDWSGARMPHKNRAGATPNGPER